MGSNTDPKQWAKDILVKHEDLSGRHAVFTGMVCSVMKNEKTTDSYKLASIKGYVDAFEELEKEDIDESKL